MENGGQRPERIGKVTLDYRFYPGEDRYSDGGIEDEMLDLAKEYGGGDYNKVIAQKKSWPVLYHFSHVRKNIVEWLPMTGREHVLEIGAGPGAVTGILAQKAKDVTCIDLSKKRSLINAYRNRDCENIRILVGNFQDVAGGLEEKFDLITLIGVFEYAQFSIQSPDPFADYLLAVRRLLAPGGRVVIAIENRLGLKYWAGATEDHTGLYFEGLEGYPTTDYVRTFSKPELEHLLDRAGLRSREFYYPYPDYKLPERIYSDGFLPRTGELNRNIQNFDRQRLQVFSEEKVYDSLVGSGLYPLYANSFLVIAGEEENARTDGAKICCCKYSNERSGRFRIRTDILEKAGGGRAVRKRAACPQAAEHVASVYRKYQALEKDLARTEIRVNRCERKGEEVYLEWLEGKTLEEELDGLLFAGRTEEALRKIGAYFAMVSSGEDLEEFRETGEFRRIFGACPGSGAAAGPQGHAAAASKAEEEAVRAMLLSQRCRRVSDIDMIFSNVIHTDRGYELIDYEWTFDFPVPVKFLLYRCIRYYVLGNTRREELLGAEDLYAQAGITPRERKWFASMEDRFQQYMLGEYQPAWKLYDVISEGVIPVRPLAEQAAGTKRTRLAVVSFDCGDGFVPEQDRQYRLSSGTRRQLTIDPPGGARALRIRLDGGKCVVRVAALAQAGRTLSYTTNGSRMPNGDYLFDDEAVEFAVPRLSGDGGPVEFTFYLEPVGGIVREAVLAQDGRIRWIEQTKVWRLYRAVKKLLGKEV